MTTEESTQKEEISEVQKSESSDPSALSILADIVKRQDEKIDLFSKKFDELTALVKEHNANPVDQGVEAENKPKTEDADDVGDKVTAGNEVAPKPSESQASIIAPAVEESKTDEGDLKMENKSDDEDKEDEKKEEVEKMDDKEEKKEEVKKSDSVYEVVEPIRPFAKAQVDVEQVPTGYQVLKATINGFGVTSSAEEALIEMHNRFEKGEFGNGQPSGVY